MCQTDVISSIQPENSSTWENKKFLTFDVDWAHDDVLNHTIDLVEKEDVYATWFITHKTEVLQRLKENPKFELGIHPNFNFLLTGKEGVYNNSEIILDKILEIVPDAKSVRSHSMTQNSNLLDLFKRKGLSHDSNHFIPCEADILLKPWVLWNGLIKCPYFWEDDVSCISKDHSIDNSFNSKGIKIYDFHPIHVFLNTEDLKRYESTRAIHNDPAQLKNFSYNGVGTKNNLMKLLTHNN